MKLCNADSSAVSRSIRSRNLCKFFWSSIFMSAFNSSPLPDELFFSLSCFSKVRNDSDKSLFTKCTQQCGCLRTGTCSRTIHSAARSIFSHCQCRSLFARIYSIHLNFLQPVAFACYQWTCEWFLSTHFPCRTWRMPIGRLGTVTTWIRNGFANFIQVIQCLCCAVRGAYRWPSNALSCL